MNVNRISIFHLLATFQLYFCCFLLVVVDGEVLGAQRLASRTLSRAAPYSFQLLFFRTSTGHPGLTAPRLFASRCHAPSRAASGARQSTFQVLLPCCSPLQFMKLKNFAPCCCTFRSNLQNRIHGILFSSALCPWWISVLPRLWVPVADTTPSWASEPVCFPRTTNFIYTTFHFIRSTF